MEVAYSPDFKLIKHVWHQLQCAVHARMTNTSTLTALRQMLVEEWDVIP